ncbi:MAG: Gfo/Idh/MocA family oxidoreductase [Planctomycetia bacterium]|nr:Gfo/Idh/MocA family oxidoreductase [Planctomycetia bacterium]
MSQSNRRNFLKVSGLAAGAAAVSSLGVSRSAYAEGAEKIKAVLIGCGGRGKGAANDFLQNEGTEIVAVADAFENNAKNAMETFKVPADKCFWGFDAFRKALACDCQYVILATPPGFRPIHFKAAVEAGKHVFMEKPCCVDAPGFNMLIDACKMADEKNLKVGVGLQRHHEKAYLNGIKEIVDGKYGDILYTRVYWNGGGVWVRGRNPEWTEMEYQMRNWYYFNWLCGDNICEQHVHNLDIGNWVMSVTNTELYNMTDKYAHPVRVNAMGGREVRKGSVNYGEIYDHHFCEFEYADGRRMYSQCRHQPNTWNNVSESAIGSKGQGGVSSRGGGRNPYQQEHTDLIAAIKSGAKYNEGWLGAYSSMTAVLGRYASYSGQSISWDDAVANGPALMIYDGNDQLTMQSEAPVKPLAEPTETKEAYAIAVPGVWKPW